MLTNPVINLETKPLNECGRSIEQNSVEKLEDNCKEHDKFRSERRSFYQDILYLAVLHIMAPFAIYEFLTHLNLQNILWVITYILYGGFAITAGAHRLWSHRSYKAKLPLRLILIIGYRMSPMHHLYHWVHNHRLHHKHSDTDADPHNAKRGFFFSHIGWLLQKEHPDVTSRKMDIDISDIINDPLIRFQDEYFWTVKLLLNILMPTAIPVYLWQESWYCGASLMVVCNMYILHATFCVNSVNHKWGQRPYNKSILPVENLAMGFVSIGEGWHNYHHAFPWDYKACEFGMSRFSFTTVLLNFFAKIGWAYDLKEPSPKLVESYIRNYGDGSHHGSEKWNKFLIIINWGNIGYGPLMTCLLITVLTLLHQVMSGRYYHQCAILPQLTLLEEIKNLNTVTDRH